MKIDFITDKVYPYFIGGQEKRIFEYSKILKEAGHEITIVSMQWWPGERIMAKDGIRYKSLCKRYDLYHSSGKRNILASFLFGVKVFFHALKTDAAIVDCEVFPYLPIVFTKLAKTIGRKKYKIFGYWAEFWGKPYWKQYFPVMWPLGVILEKLCVSCADRHIANSQFTRRRILDNFPEKKEIVTSCYPFAINEKYLSLAANNIEKQYDLIYFGRLIFHKHVEKVIDMTKRLHENGYAAKTLIIGQGPEKEGLKKQARDLGINESIAFIDFIEDYDKLLTAIRTAKIMVFPSEREGFGIAVLEGMLCGLPVIAWDFPDNAAKELITDSMTGHICQDDRAALEKIYQLLNTQSYLAMGRSAAIKARAFSEEELRKQVMMIYKSNIL